jgi:hypothetical protein
VLETIETAGFPVVVSTRDADPNLNHLPSGLSSNYMFIYEVGFYSKTKVTPEN